MTRTLGDILDAIARKLKQQTRGMAIVLQPLVVSDDPGDGLGAYDGPTIDAHILTLDRQEHLTMAWLWFGADAAGLALADPAALGMAAEQRRRLTHAAQLDEKAAEALQQQLATALRRYFADVRVCADKAETAAAVAALWSGRANASALIEELRAQHRVAN